MKYYCDNCGCEVISTDTQPEYVGCPICLADKPMLNIPTYETPDQREKRTGKPVSDDTVVFYRPYDPEEWRGWALYSYGEIKHKIASHGYRDGYILIADPPTPPPEDWQMEGE